MTQPAFVGSFRPSAGSEQTLNLTLSESLSLCGHVSLVDTSDLTVVLFGNLSDRASLARRLGSAEVTLPHGAHLASLLIEACGFDWLPESSGDFAVVACNHRTGTLVLARNHVGTRPLYYRAAGGELHFSSDVSPVLPLMHQGSAIPFLPAVASFLVGEAPPMGTTLAEGVWSVPPGHVLTWNLDSSRLVRYWNPHGLQTSPERPRIDAAAELHDLLQVAVRESLPSVGMVGTHLTGGIDSAIVAADLKSSCLATDRPTPLAFVWHRNSIRESETIDVHLIKAMSAELDMPVTWADTDNSAAWAALSRNPIEQPTTSTLLHEAGVQVAASARGVTTLFSGWGGDEFASYNGRHLRSGPLRVTAHRLRQLVAPRDPQRTNAGHMRGYASTAVRGHYQPSTLTALATLRTAKATQICLLNGGHLNERTDSWSSAAAPFGIQYAYPLLDRRVVEWALALPNSMVDSGRILMREALADVVPDEVRLNTDKSEPMRSIDSALDDLQARGLDLTVDPRLTPLVDLQRFATELLSDGAVLQPGKFMAAAMLIYQPEGTPLGELVTLP